MPGRWHTEETIRISLEDLFDYDLCPRLEQIRPGYTFDVTCPGSVPEAIRKQVEQHLDARLLDVVRRFMNRA